MVDNPKQTKGLNVKKPLENMPLEMQRFYENYSYLQTKNLEI
jgi:hypothetical protein